MHSLDLDRLLQEIVFESITSHCARGEYSHGCIGAGLTCQKSAVGLSNPELLDLADESYGPRAVLVKVTPLSHAPLGPPPSIHRPDFSSCSGARISA